MATAKKGIKQPATKKAAANKKVTATKSVVKSAIKPAATKTTPKPVVKSASKPANSKVTEVKMPNPVFNIDEITELMKAVNHSNVNELKLEKGDFKITIRQGGVVVASAPVVAAPQVLAASAPIASAPVAALAPAPVVDNSLDNLITIKSPMIGTFYRSAGPGKPVFVNVGDDIKVGSVLCIIEAMKLFNEIESEISGKIVKVLIDDATPVEYDQPLFLVQP